MHAPRSFLINLAPDVRAIVTVSIEYDISLPTPGESEEWIPAPPVKMQIREAIAALHCAKDLARHEIAWKRPVPEREVVTFGSNGEVVARAYYQDGSVQDIHKAGEVPA